MNIDRFDIPPTDTAPLPLSRSAALSHAAVLKRKGWAWTAIASAMGEYHGQWLSASSWRWMAVQAGLELPTRRMTPAKIEALRRVQEHNREAFERRRVARKQPVDGVSV
jgi:hypothetical protein